MDRRSSPGAAVPSVPSSSRAAGRRRAADRVEPAHARADFHEPRRPDCPWCGSQRVSPRPPAPSGARRLRAGLTVAHLAQGGPGDVPLDACGDCGHVFQNPRLTAEGLARHLHGRAEGRVARPLERRLTALRHRSAARALLPFPEPEGWLDVGTGEGHFPAAAQEFFPYTSFDGVDTDRRVVRAYAAGRVEEAHVGRLTDPHIAARLRARYDVVSMLHHLERTPDPRAELLAALTVLRPGGHLLLELTGPRGSWWTAPADPADLHLPHPANVEAELHAEGCTILTAPRRARPSGRYRVLARRN
ncbi:class I SAM-dependent methyltransferase [Streptomyces sp. DH24]|uniref:class I SAM-dependent methyltransferase n=1 Tax=Streptomyces sp. DH24 TaxID=3040123 RepID=UPI002441D1BF|nr:class I SAM-dependent methyltransferase [Streptomyces sp. DH24]MDG9716159.1 class I SAM-dependent methyltransferase [Streptomyces sp. DH24]